MRVLIMSLSTGEGHNSTAKALKTQLENRGAVVAIVDTYAYISEALSKLVSQGYLFVSGKTKEAFGIGYRMGEKRTSNSNEKSATRLANHIFIKKINECITNFEPSLIVFTHPFAGIIVDIMKQRGMIPTKTVGILTDFTFHPYWEECLYSDYVITPAPQLLYQALMKGFRPEQIKPLGIPINPKFSQSVSKEEARTRLGLDPDLHTIMFMGGSMGHGNLRRQIAELDRLDAPFNFQIISVCGNNAAAKDKIDALETNHRVLNFGFTSEVDLIMDASDCLVGKPGGLSTSEALAKRLPMIIFAPIPGQEERNSEFLMNCGAAMRQSDTCSVSELVYQLFTVPGRLETIKASIETLRHPDSAREVCEFLFTLCSDDMLSARLGGN